MSPEPDKQNAATAIAKENITPKIGEININDGPVAASVTPITTSTLETSNVHNSGSSRERRTQSPSTFNAGILDSLSEPPASPCSSSSADATFEPTIDMMVNDFDDEQTLNEEEALADQEAHNADDEIATLREESEMPIEELLAKYGAINSYEPPPRKKAKKSKKSKRRVDKEHKQLTAEQVNDTHKQQTDEITLINADLGCDSTFASSECGEEQPEQPVPVNAAPCSDDDEEEDEDTLEETELNKTEDIAGAENIRKPLQHRSHLLDLYPEGTFDDIVPCERDKESLFNNLNGDECEDIDDGAEEEEDAETDSDCFKKSVMVGPEYQAAIPEGLSQYGDVLPYENEDKLIWEPSQVSEREVEEYLLRARDIKPTMLDEDAGFDEESNANVADKNNDSAEKPNEKSKIEKLNEDKLLGNGGELNGSEQAIVKDNEQALHLLVQCGYDFKEALRRKRLNVLPLTGTMSLWSEEECQKFEEGIQKFGKDFLKIRQQLVRTRTMRELVQFYYLWKKSDRRDQNFANSDTVDHMDIYLNESTDYGPTNVVGGASSLTAASGNSNRKNAAAGHKNISIMAKNAGTATTPQQTSGAASANSTASPTKLANNRRRISLQEHSQKNDAPAETNQE